MSVEHAARARAMDPFWSRVLIALIGLPAVLGLVWLGGWWLWGLAAVTTILALHELFTMVRRLRPLVLAGYGGALLALVGAEVGGVDWLLGGFLATFLLSFALFGISESRQPATVAMGSTLMGVSWVALGMGHLILLRDLGTPSVGRTIAFAVLLAVWADDTVAYFAGKLIGRHRMAPTLSPGKTWEGFVAGSAAAIFVTFVTFWHHDYGVLEGWRPVVLGAVIAVAGAIGDLFESALKRDMEVKDTGRLLAGHGGVLDRIDALLFATVAAYYTILAIS